MLAGYLDDGRLNLTTLVELRDVLHEERLDAVLARAAGRNEEQVKELVAALRPREAPAEMLRRLPVAASSAEAVPPRLASDPIPAQSSQASYPAPVAPAEGSTPPVDQPRRARLEPVSAGLQVLRVTVDEAFVADLHAVRDLLSHQLPGGRLDQILHHALRVAREQAERGSGHATPAARKPSSSGRPASITRTEPPTCEWPTAKGRYVPVAVRDEVWRRDAGRCTFAGTSGHRCGSSHQLELHHIVPFARGGAATVTNLTLHCRAHNAYQAGQDFGPAHLARSIADRQASLF